jgi:hypothetical protein
VSVIAMAFAVVLMLALPLAAGAQMATPAPFTGSELGTIAGDVRAAFLIVVAGAIPLFVIFWGVKKGISWVRKMAH